MCSNDMELMRFDMGINMLGRPTLHHLRMKVHIVTTSFIMTWFVSS